MYSEGSAYFLRPRLGCPVCEGKARGVWFGVVIVARREIRLASRVDSDK